MRRQRLGGLSASWRDTWKATDPANRAQDEQAMKMYLQDNGIKVNADGTVTLYHATDKQSAASIKKDGFFKPTTGKNILEKIDNAAWFSTDKEWVKIWGHTKTPTILTVKVPAIYLRHMPMNFKEFYFEGGLHKRNRFWTPVRAPKENWVMKIARRNWEEINEPLGYVPTPRESRAGKRLFYMLSKDYGGHPTTLPRKNRRYWTDRSGELGVNVYALFAYSADDAREQIRKGDVPPIHEERGREAEREALVRPSYRPERMPLSRKPVKWFYMFVKKGFRKPKSVGIHQASFYQREMSRGRGTLYQVKARTADEARRLIKAGKKEPARLAPKPRAPRRTEAERKAISKALTRSRSALIPLPGEPFMPPPGEQLTLFGGVKYYKGDLNSTVKAAQKTVGKKPLYIFATSGGYTISKRKPPGTQGYLLVKPDKTVETHNPEYLSLPDIHYRPRIFAMPMSVWEGYAQRMTEAEFASQYAHAYMRTVKRPTEKSVKAHKAEAKILYWQLRKVEPEQLRLLGKVSYMPKAWERARGKRNYYLSAAHLSDGSILFIEKHSVGQWLRRKETIRVEYHAVDAYSEEHARMIIEAGGSKPYYLSIGHHYRTPKAAEQLRLFGFSGFSGDISTCAYWIATNGDWTCGSYLPTCEAQAPGACKIPPPAQYKFCATTQKVKSNPKGRYRGKLITRCKTYRSRCMPDSGCIEDRLFPKPETFKLDPKEIQEVAASMAKEFNLLQKQTGPALAREILDRGGLKAYRGKVESEEWAEIPLHLKRKTGMPLDEMASEMGFDDEKDLRVAIERAYPKGKKTIRRKTWKDYKAEAEQVLIDEQQRSEYAYEEPVPF